jgi:UDP-N-acetyl-D-galactosamine dehydrogenase
MSKLFEFDVFEFEVGVVGLGYVGLPVAVEFGKVTPTLGFDISSNRISQLKSGLDSTLEVSKEQLASAVKTIYSNDPKDLSKCQFIIVCVPTPVDLSNQPDFTPLIKASESVGKCLKSGMTVIYESTVYPGATEEICVPILERESGLKWKKDFFIGYSPERINPGDTVHTLSSVVKVVAGDTTDTLLKVANLYRKIIKAGVFEATSIAVAEAAKVLENTQRDINIALINECAMIFQKMGIDTRSVLEAARTKWNFLDFRPGLVGGHCIGVDPYYLTYKAQAIGVHPQVILAGRAVNDGMAKFVAEQTVKLMVKNKVPLTQSKVAIYGLTFKENVQDIRNSKVIDIYRELKEYGVSCIVIDPVCKPEDALEEFELELTKDPKGHEFDAIILAVAHRVFLDKGLDTLLHGLKKRGVFVDVKAAYSFKELQDKDLVYWRL